MGSPQTRSVLFVVWAIGLTAGFVVGETEIKKDSTYQALDIVGKSPKELIELRGFRSEVHYVHTKDGYHVQVVRIVHPDLRGTKLKRPVIFNHGLIESATIWLINTLEVKPIPVNDICGEVTANNETIFYRNTAMMLANSGYDVWLMSMRATDFSMKHDKLTPKDKQFWNYCLDDFALTDVPSVIDYVREKTGSPKVGYIGHSQATFSIFGLLSIRPHYAERVEPIIAVAPVAWVKHITSISRLVFQAAAAMSKDAHGPFPPIARVIRTALSATCTRSKKTSVVKVACDLIEMLIGGKGEHWLKGHFSHMPFYSSFKVIRHFGQLVNDGRYAMYDYGKEENLRLYGRERSPEYPVGNITSKSLCLIYSRTDALSPLADVEHFKSQLRVPLHKEIFINENINHFDMLIDQNAASRVSKPVLKIFEALEHKSGICADYNIHFDAGDTLSQGEAMIGEQDEHDDYGYHDEHTDLEFSDQDDY